MGHDDFTGHAWRLHLPVFMDNFDDDIVCREMHATGRAFVGNEACIASAISVGHPASKHLADRCALVVIQTFGRDEGDFDSKIVHANAALLRMLGNVRQGRGVAKQHPGFDRANGGDELVEFCLGHFKRRQQLGAQEFVSPVFDAVLLAQLNRRTPNHNFRVANVHTPPAGGPPFGRHVVAHAFVCYEKNQRFTRRAPGVEAGQALRMLMFEPLSIGTDDRLGQKWQALQVVRTLDVGRIKPDLLETVAVVGHMQSDIPQKLTQTLKLIGSYFCGRQPLNLLHSAPHRNGVMPFKALVNWKHD